MDNEDKLAWCEKFGADAELAFAAGRMHQIGLATYLNPEKRENKYAHDLFTVFPSDLKTVRTPLFKAAELYGIDPQYAVTFNVKDGVRYKTLYPNIVVIFDVKWDVCSMDINGVAYRVEPMHSTYAGFLQDIRAAILKSGNRKITYAQRVADTNGNAKESYVFDVRHLHKISKE